MKKLLLKTSLFTLLGVFTLQAQSDYTFDTDADDEGWVAAPTGKMTESVAGGLYTVTATGTNANIQLRGGADAGAAGENTLVIVDVASHSFAAATVITIGRATNTYLDLNQSLGAGTGPEQYVFNIANANGGAGDAMWTGTPQLRVRFQGGAIAVNDVVSIDRIQVVDPTSLSNGETVFQSLKTNVIGERGAIRVVNAPDNSKIEAFDITGKTTALTNLATGVYVVRISVEGQMMSKKVVVQ